MMGRISMRWLLLGAVALIGAVGAWLWLKPQPARPASEGEAAVAARLADAGFGPRQREAIEALVRAYILDHPEVVPEAVERLRAREAQAAIEPLRGQLEAPFPGAVLGNPQGRHVLVEFSDFACTYCRRAEADVAALIAADPQLKVVIRLLPIIGPASEPAARMGLAAAGQGKYAAYHRAIYAGAPASSATIASAARAAGLDAGAEGAARSAAVTGELEANLTLARQLGIEGTPAWVAGSQLISGAVGKQRLADALAQAGNVPAAGLQDGGIVRR